MWTVAHSARTARHAMACATVAALAIGLLAASESPARDRPSGPRLVWASGARVFIATPDSGVLAPRMRVLVFDRDREAARGEVTEVLDGVLASVVLTSGTIAADARLDAFDVRLEPALERATPSLRLGLPASGRTGLAGPCRASRLDPAALPRAYRPETLAVDAVRLVAGDSVSAGSAWPETLFVRFFGDHADEEIALERGELDLALFWPGEPSARLREEASGFVPLLGVRARDGLAATGLPTDPPRASRAAADLAALNAGLFAGDLLPWNGTAARTPASTGALHYAVDPALPGQRAIERFLNRRWAARPGSSGPAVRIVPFEAGGATGDSLDAALRARGLTPLFSLRCPVLCAPGRAADARRLDADSLADLIGCVSAVRR